MPSTNGSEDSVIVHTIKLLLGGRESSFKSERQLKLFQFLWWLLDDKDDDCSIKDAGLVYASAALSYKIQKNNVVGPSEALILSSSDPWIQRIFRAIEWRQDGFYHLLRIRYPLLHSFDFNEIIPEIESLSDFVEAKLRLYASDCAMTDNNAFTVMKRQDPERGRPQVKSHLTAPKNNRLTRLPFIYAAIKHHPQMIRFSLGAATKGRMLGASEMLALSKKNAATPEGLKAFFACAKGVVEVTDKKLASKLAKAWPDLTAARPAVDLLHPDQLSKLNKRRGAEETKKAKRQSPPA